MRKKKVGHAMSRVCIELTAVWGNDDAESTIKVSRRMWAKIQNGAEYATSAWSWYEGKRYRVAWRFNSGNVSVDNADGEYFGGSVSVLFVREPSR
jgi:hypothetical protein